MSHPFLVAQVCAFGLMAGLARGEAKPASRPLTPAGPPPVAVAPAPDAQPPASRPVEPAAIGNDLDELRRFEESAFPRHGAAGPRTLEETAAPPARPTTDSPPPGVHSDEHGTRQPAAPATPPEPWLAALALPDLPIRWDAKLVRYLEFYRSNPKGRAIMSLWLRRVGRYGRLISQTLHRQQLPQALLYVAMIESGFNPKVTSRAGAAGVWQFMAGVGRDYGLQRDHWVDERRNPEKSTEAALRYLRDLHKRFGSWELALAAYNAGHGGVVLSMRKYNTNDYWQLCRYEAGLPWETVLYVPKILAAAVVGSNRGAFGFEGLAPEPEQATALVSVPGSVTLAQAASAAGVGKEIVEQLNPELVRGRTPPGKSWLRVPKASEQRFYAGLASIKGQLARYKPYQVRLGESLADVARAHGTTAAALRALNVIEASTDLRPGLVILVPARIASAQPTSEAEVEPPDDETVLVPLPADRPTALAGRRRVFYRTIMGDRLDEIAKHLGVSRTDLASWNSLDESARLVSGMVLQAFVDERFDASRVVLLDARRVKLMTAGSDEFYSAWEERKGRRRIVYAIRDGDTLSSIGKRYGVSLGDLMRINQLGGKTKLKLGQKLVLYVESARLKPKPPRTRSKKGDEVAEGAPAVEEATPADERSEPRAAADGVAAPERRKRVSEGGASEQP